MVYIILIHLFQEHFKNNRVTLILENNLVEKNFEVNNFRDYGTESNILVAHIDPSESLRVNSAVITLRTQC